MPVSTLSIPELAAAVGRELSAVVEVDTWAPTVQGAVGHVVGLRGADGSSYVLKVYRPREGRRSATEALALRLFGGLGDVPVPAVVLHGELAGDTPLVYLLMTRLAGVRWADRRSDLDARQSSALHTRVGELLRRMHVLSHERFGDLLHDGPRWPNAWVTVDARCDRLVGAHVRAGGPVEVGRRVRRMVDDQRAAFSSRVHPVLCHNDLIDSNILVAATGEPQLCGVVDLERASWDDPLTDLARTRLHARHHDDAASELLVEAYGLQGDDEHDRVSVHEVLHALEERTWITSDRPAGWRRSVAALDAFLMGNT